jgi:hypothetical protein
VKKTLISILLMVMLATACVTIVAPAPGSTPPAVTPPVSAPPPAATQPVNPAQPTPASFNLPTVTVFAVTPANIMSGNGATLTWDIGNSYDVAIEPGFGIIRPRGSQPVNPPFTTTYKLTANNSEGSILATTTLTVSGTPPSVDTPVVKSFTADPYVIRKGESSVLKWQTIGGSSIVIDKELSSMYWPADGTTQVSPAVTTTYMLTVTSPDGGQFQTVTVNVR